ncbi:hypothetical protein IL306_008857, partial [Fusarium sp. DS 682]
DDSNAEYTNRVTWEGSGIERTKRAVQDGVAGVKEIQEYGPFSPDPSPTPGSPQQRAQGLATNSR